MVDHSREPWLKAPKSTNYEKETTMNAQKQEDTIARAADLARAIANTLDLIQANGAKLDRAIANILDLARAIWYKRSGARRAKLLECRLTTLTRPYCPPNALSSQTG